ncbi:carboxylesterase/lipase family protein [Robbsia andropogonis]|uniref:carboxylesterase/lipase family protein n=1 Tax=Robbsia andropogonis TaxID=28092 RepID=UPI0012F8EBCA|nr:carboxylesterase family protein [Robbsia andropogonis]
MKGRRAFLQHSAALTAVASWPFLAHAAPRRAPSPREAVSLKTPAGPLRGMRQDGVDVYKGIPYAQPPVGELRFKPPLPLPSPGWDDTWNAFAFGPAPIQAVRKLPGSDQSLLGDVPLDEDCLRLNVWAPVDPGTHPVFVWIYGGSNIAGAASQPLYDGTHFAEQGIVCVTLNYRVGALGFLELGSVLGDAYRGSGNNANRDQLMALQWVRQNIAAFGGDPARVTLAGESAGGKAVAALMAMPASAGLFQSAIIESGGGQTVHDLPEADRVTGIFLQALDKQGLKKEDLLSASTAQILQAQAATIANYQRAFAFRSVVDGAMLMARPQDAIAKGASNQVRLLIGSNRDESLVFFSPESVAAGRKDPSVAAPFLPRELAQLRVADMEKASARYQQTFSSLSAFDRRIRLLTAEEYWVPTVRLADAHALAGAIRGPIASNGHWLLAPSRDIPCTARNCRLSGAIWTIHSHRCTTRAVRRCRPLARPCRRHGLLSSRVMRPHRGCCRAGCPIRPIRRSCARPCWSMTIQPHMRARARKIRTTAARPRVKRCCCVTSPRWHRIHRVTSWPCGTVCYDPPGGMGLACAGRRYRRL